MSDILRRSARNPEDIDDQIGNYNFHSGLYVGGIAVALAVGEIAHQADDSAPLYGVAAVAALFAVFHYGKTVMDSFRVGGNVWGNLLDIMKQPED